MSLSHLFILVAVVLFLWAALIVGFELDYGNAAFIALLGAASFSAGHLPWGDRALF